MGGIGTLAELEIEEGAQGFGVVEVRGVDPRRRPAPERLEGLRDALARHAVLCLRMPEALDEAGLRRVVELFGPIKDPVAPDREGRPFRYSEERQIIDSGFVMTDEVRAKLGELQLGGLDDERPGLFETFHCDDTFTPEPASATVLHARQLPPSGGGPTVFMDMRAAWAELDSDTRHSLEGLRVAYAYDNHGVFPPRRAAKGPAEVLAEVSHPLVRRHSRTGGRALFIDLDRATHVEGMDPAEGRRLLQSLQDRAEARAPRCQHAWRDHDVLVWDNASVQHKAGGDFPVGEPRRFWRFMVAGERPV